MNKFLLYGLVSLAFLSIPAMAQEPTYAERLGWAPGAKVVILHIDDAGMSHGSNLGTIQAMEEGLATSCSIMMPCSWVSEYARHLESHPDTDAGLHLTFTSEWSGYRWGPLAGKSQVPGLVDKEGCFWPEVVDVIAHASADEIEKEIRAQVDRAQTMGIDFTHLDSHMGTLFATPVYTERYIKVGIELGIPVLLPGGHLQYISQESPLPMEQVRAAAGQLWEAGLPVVDDILASTYDWKKEDKVEKYMEALRGMKPGILEVILHCSEPTEEFPAFTGSSETRKGDLMAMLDPRLAQCIKDEGIVLTTWRELKQRRDQVGK